MTRTRSAAAALVLVAGVALTVVVVRHYACDEPERFESTFRLEVEIQEYSQGDVAISVVDPSERRRVYPTLVDSDEVISRVVGRFANSDRTAPEVEGLRDAIGATAPSASTLVVRVTDRDPARAQELAEVVSDVVSAYIVEVEPFPAEVTTAQPASLSTDPLPRCV